ncbi:MAG TPA: UDP-N-acetylmuramoyl-L-alanine--D-glutamate ligase, partial [Nitrospiria bacterium]|nr:UDP-N-acetylmuramoyl-L-alanine--D-glutamate ligase [Nitrospiria bacterium]
MDLKDKRVTVVGLARSGAAAARLLLRERAVVSVTDRRPPAELAEWTKAFGPGDVRWFLGGHPDEAFLGADLIVLSPGVPVASPPLQAAKAKGIPIWSELELASRFVSAPISAITGSNGKSTTTALAAAMCGAAGRRTFIGGNYGVPLSEATLPGAAWGEVVVEVSSFQLETVTTFHPVVAALLNVTPDHLDRYPNVAAYAAAKFRLFEHQGRDDAAVLNADDPVCVDPAFTARLAARRVSFSRRSAPSGDAVWVDNGAITYRMGERNGRVLEVDRLRIAGVHNVENALAATAVALSRGIDPAVIATVLSEFRGLEHRMELVRDLRGVTYINDSKGTNVGAVQKSLESVSRPIILIAGGVGKGADFSALRPLVMRRVKKAVLIGQARPQLRQAFEGITTVAEANGMEEAVRIAADSA